MDKVSVVLVNYNGIKYNDDCIESIFKSTITDRIHVVVVDNKSADDSLQALQDKWGKDQRVTILPLDDNYGFSKANNEGIKWSFDKGMETVLLLNNDTVTEPDAIEKMISLQKEKNAIVVPKVKYFDKKDTIWCAGGTFSKTVKKAGHRGLDRKDEGQYDLNEETEFANGCALAVNKEIIDKIGYLDERFFLYYEDTEFSLRAEENNIPIWYCADAVIYHKVNGSTGGISKPVNDYYISRNWLLCNSLHLKRLNRILFNAYFYLNRTVWSAICLITGRSQNSKAVWRGIKDFKKGIFGRKDDL